MRFGVHVSIGDGFFRAVDKARSLGCEAFQIFAGNPRGWARKPLSDGDAARFRQALAMSGLGPAIVHLSYLPNLANLDDELYERSVLALGEDYARANRLGAEYLVVHPGSCPPERKGEGLDRVVRAVEAVLAQVHGPTRLLLENQGSRRRDLGADLAELAALARRCGDGRVGICLDTCHAFVAGYDLRTVEGWRQAVGLLERALGAGCVLAVHANDSRGDLGSGLDRHEHIGRGRLGGEAFRALGRFGFPDELPVILETPQDDPADDPRNLAAVRELTAACR